MTMKDIIKEKRKELGLTQEQVANYLGVTAPAVNKWENGITFPDITLLAPIARLLHIDVNTLLCFNEDLTEHEINQFSMEVMTTMQTEGFEAGYQLTQKKIDEYPNSTKLLHTMALMLDGGLVMLGLSQEDKAQYEDSILGLYERLAKNDDKETSESARFMLASKYLNKHDYDKAQSMIDSLPKPSVLDKRLLQANLYDLKEEYDKSKDIHERILMTNVTNVWNHMLSLMETEIKQGNIEYAKKLAKINSEGAKLYQLKEYYVIVPQMMIAAAEKEEEKCITLIEELISSSGEITSITDAQLYQHINISQSQEKQSNISIIPALMQQLRTDECFDFLRKNERFQQLVK